MRRAISLVEVLVVVGILAVLAGLLVPVFGRARHAAREAVVVENLRQWHHAITLYRMSQGSGEGYGSLEALGIPDCITWFDSTLGLGDRALLSPCGRHPHLPLPGPFSAREDMAAPAKDMQLYYVACNNPDALRADAPLYRENLYLVADPNCSPPEWRIDSQYSKKRSFAILLSGKIVRQERSGIDHHPSFYADPPP